MSFQLDMKNQQKIKRMKNFIFILLVIWINSCFLKEVISPEVFESEIIKCIRRDLVADNELCLRLDSNEINQKLKFYQTELLFFHLDDVFEDITKVVNKQKITQQDTLGILLFYPYVGFDPEFGYETSYILYGPSLQNRNIIANYNRKREYFEYIEITTNQVRENLRSYQALKNGCGSGYLIYFFSSFNSKEDGCICAYNLDM